jgi:hypothetical protein
MGSLPGFTGLFIGVGASLAGDLPLWDFSHQQVLFDIKLHSAE